MEQERSFCLFEGDGGPTAVLVESVAAVLETEALVPLVWSPPQVVGLCPHHRGVVPVVSLKPDPRGAATSAGDRGDGRAAVASADSPARGCDDASTRCAVLVLKSEHDLWGLRINALGTSITRGSPVEHTLRTDASSAVWTGMIRSGETRYALLDAEATWRGLRVAVSRWYGLLSETKLDSVVPGGRGTSGQAGTAAEQGG
jgi:hypothetical protein